WKAQYGPWEPLTVGTYIWPWVFRVSNLGLKWRFYNDGKLSLATSLGFFHFDTKDLRRVDEKTGDAKIDVPPFELVGTYRFDSRDTLSLAWVFIRVRVDGTLDNGDLRGTAQGAVDNLQTALLFEWRTSEVTAFTAELRNLIFQRAIASGDAVLHPD